MTLDLSNVVLPYKEFYGKNVEQMPKLLAEGRVPLSVAGIMEQRLRSGKQDWKDNYFDTGDAFAYHPNGNFKIVTDARLLRDITSASKLRNGALVLQDGVYESLQGQEFTRKDMEKLVERELSAEEVKAHPIWNRLARDRAMLTEYVDTMFAEMNKRFKYTENMGVYLSSAEKVPTARAAVVFGLEPGSRLCSRYDLVNGDGRFAGVAPEGAECAGQSASNLV